MKTRTLTATMLVVLSLASSAHAECAWVLWQHRVQIGPQNTVRSVGWQIDGGFSSVSDCHVSRDAQAQRFPPTKAVGSDYSEYTCLPDTVDPRGPRRIRSE
jgi:hypothetical protein